MIPLLCIEVEVELLQRLLVPQLADGQGRVVRPEAYHQPEEERVDHAPRRQHPAEITDQLQEILLLLVDPVDVGVALAEEELVPEDEGLVELPQRHAQQHHDEGREHQQGEVGQRAVVLQGEDVLGDVVEQAVEDEHAAQGQQDVVDAVQVGRVRRENVARLQPLLLLIGCCCCRLGRRLIGGEQVRDGRR